MENTNDINLKEPQYTCTEANGTPVVIKDHSINHQEIISELINAGGEKLSDSSVCLLHGTGCFYFYIFENYFTTTYCIIPTDHPSLGIQIFHHYFLDKITSLKSLFSFFDRTKALVGIF